MSSSATPHEVKHLSYSSMSAWQKCGKSYQLSRIQGIRGTPAWWNIGGNAVHSTLESWDLEQITPGPRGFSLNDAYSIALQKEIDKAEAVEPDWKKWRVKRMSSENYAWWVANGPAMCQSYITWRLNSPSWRIWTTPDGEPAIELDVSCRLPGCDREIKMFVDRVFESTIFGTLEIVDLKSGSSMGTDLQFGTYAAGLAQKYGVEARRGHTFRTRDTRTVGKDGRPRGKAPGLYTHPLPLGKWTPEYAGRQYTRMSAAVDAGVFIPNTSDEDWCQNVCDLAAHCYAVGGELAAGSDPDHPSYEG